MVWVSQCFCCCSLPNSWMVASCRRSEEHTSELQSRPHLVCRLLLEKKTATVASPSSRLILISTGPVYSGEVSTRTPWLPAEYQSFCPVRYAGHCPEPWFGPFEIWPP